MLTHIHIENYLIAKDIDIDFNEGMTTILGETGSGKSLIIDALSLACGLKNYSSKTSEDNFKIEVCFEVEDNIIKTNEFLRNYLLDDNQLVISIEAKKSRIIRKINGSISVLSSVKKITRELIDVHSQFDNLKLFNTDEQMNLLDAFGGEEFKEKLRIYQDSFNVYKNCQREINELKENYNNLDLEYLKYRIDEIKKYDLKENEIEDLNTKLNELEASSKIQETIQNINQNEQNISFVFNLIKSNLNDLEKTDYENDSKEIISKINDIQNFLENLNQISENEDAYEADKINERLYNLSFLQSKYGKNTSDILNALHDYEEKLNSSQNYEFNLNALEEKLNKYFDELIKNAKELTKLRLEKGELLAKKITEMFEDLGLKSAKFKVNVTEIDTPNNNGIDKVEFFVSINDKSSFISLKDSVSGGENSRIMFSLKYILNNYMNIPTLVFDEIDSGISGKIGFYMGKKIYEMSKETQVICISHLPQIACFSDQSIAIEKKYEDGVNTAFAYEVEMNDFADKISYLLSGETKSSASIEAAQSLISEANKLKEATK